MLKQLIQISLLASLISSCGPEVKAPPMVPAKAPEPVTVDDVFGMFYARTFEYAVTKHHPGGKFTFTRWDAKDYNELPLSERYLNKILDSSPSLRSKYVPPERLAYPKKSKDGNKFSEPLRDSLDGADVFMYSISGLDWIAASTVRVEYKRWRAPGDFMWQMVIFRQQAGVWVLIDEGPRLGDNYDKKGTWTLEETTVTPAPAKSVIQGYSK
jgi:hypothetical protein